MFNDGRFLQSILDEGKSVGLRPTLPSKSANGDANAQASGLPPVLQRYTSSALAAEPEESELTHGSEGGGGVRLKPPHLDDSLTTFASSFTLDSGTMQPGSQQGSRKETPR